jgi:tetratricopeptide (TPR) repeat protein
VWPPRARIVALPLGVAFHIGIIRSDLEIGLFAYQMLAFYLLLVPDSVFIAVWSFARWLRSYLPMPWPRGWGRWIVGWAGVALCLAIAWDAHIPHTFGVALGVTIAALVPILWGGAAWHARAGIALAFASLLVLVVDLKSDTAADYYRFWGGTTRRLGDMEASERAYRRLTEIAPENPAGHYQLGKLLLGRGDEAGLTYLRTAQRLEPNRARAYVEEAQWLRTQGRAADALGKAQEATYAEPSNPQAQGLVNALSGQRGAPAAPTPSPDDDDK